MINNKIKLSSEFKVHTTKAIISIAFFALTYILILLSTIALTALCVYGGIKLILLKPMAFTLAFGLGMAGLGLSILVFLLKFLFKRSRADRSHLYEINRTEEPRLFELIDNIADQVGTTSPKKVYLSADVNAAVFYDSSFWSMFFPVKKNLQIGLGLVNTVTQSELEAILSHEFGHFSQKTMKVGSYVYNVNHVIFNMLYDNEAYERLIQKWADTNTYIQILLTFSSWITKGIQWILRRLYDIVNKSYMALSREMEFHADEIAANVTGFAPLKDSLLRIILAEHSFNRVLTFYEKRIADNLKSDNVYRDQSFVMSFLAGYNNIPVTNNLPQVTLEELNKFNKSRLVIKDQWASHPGIGERIERLEKTGLVSKDTRHSSASEIFSNIEKTQKELTNRIFEDVQYQSDARTIQAGEFQTIFREEFLEDTFSKIYNGYYDSKNPVQFEMDTSYPSEGNIKYDELFSDQKVDMVYTAAALQNDIETLRQIADKTNNIKTFDYDGKRYKRKDSNTLLSGLESELEQINEKIKDNDVRIFKFFYECERNRNNEARLEEIYREFFELDNKFDEKYVIYSRLFGELQFVHFTTPVDKIVSNFDRIEPMESELRSGIRDLIEDGLYNKLITKEISDNFESFLSEKREYFGAHGYNEQNLNTLFTALNNYAFLLTRGYFLHKKKLLDYQEELIKDQAPRLSVAIEGATGV